MSDQGNSGSYGASADFIARAHVDASGYEKLYAASINDPDAFWRAHGKRIDWIRPYTKVKNTSFDLGNVDIKWFEDGTLNISANCIDRHLVTRGDQTAIIFEPDDPAAPARHITYKELLEQTSRMANVLKEHGIAKGDRVILYMPMIPEAAYAMLACARIGAVHSVVFGGFSPDALANRINDCQAKAVITADSAARGGRRTALKSNTDKALLDCSEKVKCFVVKHTGDQTTWVEGRDIDLKAEMAEAGAYCAYTEVGAEDPLFILYTSGSTGRPKGVVHTSGGYLVYAAMTHQYTFDYHDGDIFWCTADVGWVTGHSYIVYGPLANGATTLMFEGVPTWPDAGRFWAVCEKHQVNQFYTAPTAIRALMAFGPEPVRKYDLSSLRLLGTVG
ncbi:MAG TPA: AMP-binding protein, partial [Paracoccus sp.]|nr:AMP-binding protein [Paracoccus sp. (in: a-proteobacteria)]